MFAYADHKSATEMHQCWYKSCCICATQHTTSLRLCCCNSNSSIGKSQALWQMDACLEDWTTRASWCTYVCSKDKCGLPSRKLVLHQHNRLRKCLDSSLTHTGPFAVTQLAAPRTTHMLVEIAVLAGPRSNTAYFCCNSTPLMTTCSAGGRSRCKSKGLLSSQVVIAAAEQQCLLNYSSTFSVTTMQTTANNDQTRNTCFASA